MKILQKPISENQKDAMFYHGVIATANGYNLETVQDGEVGFNEDLYMGEGTTRLAGLGLTDDDLEAEEVLDIFVDKFFTITKDGKVVDEIHTVCNYDEAIAEFEEFLK